MKHRVFVDGQEGTTGLQIVERLTARDDVELISIDPALRKDAAARSACLNQADIAFLCLPDDAAAQSAALLSSPHTCVIDASTAHRTHPDWAYGIPELSPAHRAAIKTSKRIANPGCHATGFSLALRPLVQAGLIPHTWPLTAFSLTGYSGGGKKMIANYEPTPPALLAPRPYALGLSHKHLPEMRTHTGLTQPPLFVPVVGPFFRGMVVSIPLPLAQLPDHPSRADLHQLLATTYADEPFIRVLPLDHPDNLDQGFLDPLACNQTNRCDLALFGHDNQALLVARLDNLGKGASGAAIQSMNLHLGLPETTGLA